MVLTHCECLNANVRHVPLETAQHDIAIEQRALTMALLATADSRRTAIPPPTTGSPTCACCRPLRAALFLLSCLHARPIDGAPLPHLLSRPSRARTLSSRYVSPCTRVLPARSCIRSHSSASPGQYGRQLPLSASTATIRLYPSPM